MGKGWCKDCETEVTIHADGTAMCGCTSVELSEDMPAHWTRQEEIEEARTTEIKNQVIDVLRKTTNLISIASYLKINENKIISIHDEFLRDLEGKKFDHDDFIDALVEMLDVMAERETFDWKEINQVSASPLLALRMRAGLEMWAVQGKTIDELLRKIGGTQMNRKIRVFEQHP